jgi:hypothetical protein
MNAPKKFDIPSVGTAKILVKGETEYLFLHTACYLTKKEAANIEELGLKLIEIAQYLKRSDKES